MLAGLIFATQDADDRREALAATLPFGGATLVEFQARLLIDAGASQILIAVARVTPELLGAVHRIARRGVAVDIVRSAAEAAAKAHPLARVVVIADSLVTTEALLAPVAAEGSDLLLVTDEDPGEFERIDASGVWAGLARLDAQRLGEAAALPRDYDFQSSLLRVAAQAGATRLMLPVGSARASHGIERNSKSLANRGKAVFASLAAARVAWVDRWVFASLARWTLPPLVARGGSAGMLLALGLVAGVAGLAAVRVGWVACGLAGVGLGLASCTVGAMLGWLRGEDTSVMWCERVIAALAVLALLVTGLGEDSTRGTATASVLAVVTIVAAALVERARVLSRRRSWWGSPAAYPLLLIPFAAAAQTMLGLTALAVYAGASLFGAIESARNKP